MGCGNSKKTTADGPNTANQKTQAQQRKSTDDNLIHNNNNINNSKSSKNSSAKRTPRKTGTRQETYYTESQQGDVNKEPTDKGYKRRLRQNLVAATEQNDLEKLEKAREKFVQNHLEDCGDLTRADDKLAYLRLKRDLRDSIRRSHVGVLERTIEEAESSKFSSQLAPQIEAAKKKLQHLKELNQYSHDILKMDQFTISEIHSYHRPPACVHDVMAASYMLLGHDESTLRDWAFLQSMAGRVGRDSLIHQVRDFDSNNVDDRTAKRVREILGYHDLGEVRIASNGAATFHVWASNIVDKIDKDKDEEGERQRREEEEQMKQQASGSRKGNKKR